MTTRDIVAIKNYLLLPIMIGEKTEVICIYEDKKKIYEFEVPVGRDTGIYRLNYYAAVPIKNSRGKRLTISGDVPENFWNAVCLSDTVPFTLENRPNIHFTPRVGWMNDPNGLVYQKGLYHLFFQHNEFDTKWGNISWGHAVSGDLLHWEQRDDVLYPDEEGTIFSGCAILNARGDLELAKGAQIMLYTSAGNFSEWSKGKKFVQRMAYSLDEGSTLTKMDGSILENIAKENRDPKVYWHEESNKYFMVLYLEDNDYAICNSEDLSHWEMTQRLTLDGAWECPDLRKIPVESGGTKWVFWSADGYYFLGDFDGAEFTTDGVRHEAYQSMLPYAGQTFWGTRRVIMIPWMRSQNKDKVYTGMMGIPRQLTLVETNEGLKLRQRLVEELDEQKILLESYQCMETEYRKGIFDYAQDEESATEVKIILEEQAEFELDAYGTKCIYERMKGTLCIEGVAERSGAVADASRIVDKEKGGQGGSRYLSVGSELKEISLIFDGGILEVTADNGMVCDAFELVNDSKAGEIHACVSGDILLKIYKIS